MTGCGWSYSPDADDGLYAVWEAVAKWSSSTTKDGSTEPNTSFPPHATRQIKRLMVETRRPDVVAARAREEAAFASFFADPGTNPGSHLTAGLER